MSKIKVCPFTLPSEEYGFQCVGEGCINFSWSNMVGAFAYYEGVCCYFNRNTGHKKVVSVEEEYGKEM
jgi:hypothetical protein